MSDAFDLFAKAKATSTLKQQQTATAKACKGTSTATATVTDCPSHAKTKFRKANRSVAYRGIDLDARFPGESKAQALGEAVIGTRTKNIVCIVLEKYNGTSHIEAWMLKLFWTYGWVSTLGR